MNTSFKKALCFSLMLSLSAPVSAGPWDTFSTKQKGIIIGAATLLTLTVLYYYCRSTTKTVLPVAFDTFSDQDTTETTCSITGSSNSSNTLSIDAPLDPGIEPAQISFEQLRCIKQLSYTDVLKAYNKSSNTDLSKTKLTYLYKDIVVAEIIYIPNIWDAKYAKIEHFQIRKEFRTRGFGSKILQQVMETLKDAGYAHVMLEAKPFTASRDQWESALHKLVEFYKKNGFRVSRYGECSTHMEADLKSLKS